MANLLIPVWVVCVDASLVVSIRVLMFVVVFLDVGLWHVMSVRWAWVVGPRVARVGLEWCLF